jgi:very-short-patch-repair endonuclease
MTAAERRIWYDYLRLQPVRVLRQRPIDNFIVDFYCASRKLVIEIDGDIHSVKDAEERDILRTEILESYGLTVVRFTNAEVLNEFESVCEKLNLLLK